MNKDIKKLGVEITINMKTGNLNIANTGDWGESDKEENNKIEGAFILFMKKPILEFLQKARIIKKG